MSVTPVLPPDDAIENPPQPVWREFARAPLVPVALASSVGLMLDRYGSIPAATGWITSVVGLVLWLIARSRRAKSAAVWLWLAAGGLAAAYHHEYRHSFDADNIATFASDTPTPVRVRGTLDEEPVRSRPPRPNPLVTEQRTETTTTVLALTMIETRDGWAPTSGKARVTIEGNLGDLHANDLVEIAGRLSKPPSPANPGERDYRSQLLDQRITAVLRVEKSAAAVTRLEEGWRTSLFGWLGVIRGWGTRRIPRLAEAR